MYRRPNIVSAIGGALAIWGFVRAVFLFYKFSVSDPSPLVPPGHFFEAQTDLIIACLSSVVSFICGAFILQGANWARWLFTLKWVIVLTLEIMTYRSAGGSFIPAAILIFVQGAMVIGLFLPDSNEFFSPEF